MVTMPASSHRQLVAHLDHALDALLVVRVGLGTTSSIEPPAEALGVALGADSDYLRLRSEFTGGVNHLLDVHHDQPQVVFDLEANVNAMIATAVEIGWMVAMSTGRPA